MYEWLILDFQTNYYLEDKWNEFKEKKMWNCRFKMDHGWVSDHYGISILLNRFKSDV